MCDCEEATETARLYQNMHIGQCLERLEAARATSGEPHFYSMTKCRTWPGGAKDCGVAVASENF